VAGLQQPVLCRTRPRLPARHTRRSARRRGAATSSRYVYSRCSSCCLRRRRPCTPGRGNSAAVLRLLPTFCPGQEEKIQALGRALGRAPDLFWRFGPTGRRGCSAPHGAAAQRSPQRSFVASSARCEAPVQFGCPALSNDWPGRRLRRLTKHATPGATGEVAGTAAEAGLPPSGIRAGRLLLRCLRIRRALRLLSGLRGSSVAAHGMSASALPRARHAQSHLRRMRAPAGAAPAVNLYAKRPVARPQQRGTGGGRKGG